MAIGALLASQSNFNPQVKTDQMASVPQVAQDAQKGAKTAQTDTVTISSQALKMADDKNAQSKETARKADEQRSMQQASDKADAAKRATQKSAVKAYSAVSMSA
jgi:hypothetical protein